jgi:Protein of unknown function (DUF1488)
VITGLAEIRRRARSKALQGYTVEMAIIRAQNEVFESVEGIHFLMRDHEVRKNVPCVITREALAELGSTHDPPLARIEVFEAHRSEIERIANECWERREVDDRGILRLTSLQFR